MNANDHIPMVNIMPFGFCKKGMPCMPVTPLAWVDVNKKHIIEGAPALTEDSKLACFHGGVITIIPLDAGSAEEGDRNENAEDSVESIAAEVLAFAGSLAGKGKLINNVVKQKEVELSKPGRSKHAQQRAEQGRPVSAGRSDAQNAKRSDVLMEDDRWIVKGDNGRISVFESDGEHVTTFKNPARNTDMRIRNGRWSRPTESQLEEFKKIFNNNRI